MCCAIELIDAVGGTVVGTRVVDVSRVLSSGSGTKREQRKIGLSKRTCKLVCFSAKAQSFELAA